MSKSTVKPHSARSALGEVFPREVLVPSYVPSEVEILGGCGCGW